MADFSNYLILAIGPVILVSEKTDKAKNQNDHQYFSAVGVRKNAPKKYYFRGDSKRLRFYVAVHVVVNELDGTDLFDD